MTPLLKVSAERIVASAQVEIKPAIATAAAAASTTAQVAVIADVIQGWAAVITVLIGIPTAVLILLYWWLKFHKAWQHRNDDTPV